MEPANEAANPTQNPQAEDFPSLQNLGFRVFRIFRIFRIFRVFRVFRVFTV